MNLIYFAIFQKIKLSIKII